MSSTQDNDDDVVDHHRQQHPHLQPVGFGEKKPDLVEMNQDASAAAGGNEDEDRMTSTTNAAAAAATATATNQNAVPADKSVIYAQMAINALALAAFLVLTLRKAEFGSQYLSVSALVTPILLLWRLSAEKGGLENLPFPRMFSRFAFGFVVLLPIMIVLCLLWTGLVNLVFGFAVEKLASSAKWDVTLINFIIALVLAEESSKLLMYLSFDKRDEVEKPEYFIYFGSSTALGLVCAEVYFATYFVSSFLHAGEQKEVEFSEVIVLVVIFSGFLIPMQLIGSYYIGLAAARVQLLKKPPTEVLPVPIVLCVLWRTMFLLAIFLILPVSFPAGVGLAMATMILFIWIVLRYQDGMPVDYLRATGALHIFGYGVLPESDDGAAFSSSAAGTGSFNNNGNTGNFQPNNQGSMRGNDGDDDDDEDDDNYNDYYYNDPNVDPAELAKRRRLREQERRMRRLQQDNEANKIEVIIPPVVTSSLAVAGGSLRTMFDVVGATSPSSSSSGSSRQRTAIDEHGIVVMMNSHDDEGHPEEGVELQERN